MPLRLDCSESMRVNLVLADQVRDRGRHDHDLVRRDDAAPLFREQGLRPCTPMSRRAELGADLVLLLLRKDVDDAVDRGRRSVGVERAEDDVPRSSGRLDRGVDRLQVAHFADEDDVGIHAQGPLDSLGEGRDVVADLHAD